MTKEEISKEYEIDENGRIKSPGKFEGEMYYAVDFWNSALDGFSDSDEMLDNGTLVAIFDIHLHDQKQFPELDGISQLRIWESDQGFVYCKVW